MYLRYIPNEKFERIQGIKVAPKIKIKLNLIIVF